MKFRFGKDPIAIYNTMTVIPIRKWSPLYEIFFPLLLRLQGGGVVELLAKFYYLDYIEDKVESKLEPINISHMATGVFGCIIGLVLAALAFSVEMSSKRKKQQAAKIISVQEKQHYWSRNRKLNTFIAQYKF